MDTMEPIITPLQYTYKKPDADVWVLNTSDIPLDFTKIKDQQLVHLGPLSVGGNHKHPRKEWFIGIGDLELFWLDENGVQKSTLMHPNGQILLFEIPPFLPHAVKNISKNNVAVLFDYADDLMSDVEQMKVI